MQTDEAMGPEAVPQQPQPKHRNTSWPVVAAVVLGVIAVGLVIWALVDFDSEASGPQLETATELVDTMHEGLNEDDIEKAASAFTEGGVWLTPWGSKVAIATAFRNAETANWERVSDVVELGGGHFTFVQEMETDERTRVVVVIELDGDLLSQAQWVSEFYVPLTD